MQIVRYVFTDCTFQKNSKSYANKILCGHKIWNSIHEILFGFYLSGTIRKCETPTQYSSLVPSSFLLYYRPRACWFFPSECLLTRPHIIYGIFNGAFVSDFQSAFCQSYSIALRKKNKNADAPKSRIGLPQNIYQF